MTLDLYQKPGTLTKIDPWPIDLLVRCSFPCWIQKTKLETCTTFLTGVIEITKLWPWITSDVKVAHRSCFELFLMERYIWVRFWHKKYVFPEKMQKVNGGQKSHMGSPGVDRYADYNGPTSNPNGHLVFELSPKNRKNRFLTPNWPFMALDNMTVIFQNAPPLHLHLAPKYEPCATFLHRVITFLIFGFFLPLTAPPEIVNSTKNNRAHL